MIRGIVYSETERHLAILSLLGVMALYCGIASWNFGESVLIWEPLTLFGLFGIFGSLIGVGLVRLWSRFR